MISILGLALVLFIITAVSDNITSFFGDRDTAVKVDGEKLKYDKWKRSASQISEQMRQSGRDDVDFSYADEMALQQIVDEELFNNELEALGITVTDEEMQDYLFGPG
ncbi:MAG: SurA N-terminal domain-containing protein, partial [Muribaculaceae bacterium]|nr:SurA N-terminal domain-containing protein [Muribaculaceae bacterium]